MEPTPMEPNFSCEKQIIPVKERLGLKTYNTKTPNKWNTKCGFFLFLLEAEHILVMTLLIYTGLFGNK